MSKHYVYLDEYGSPVRVDLDTGEVSKKEITAEELLQYVLVTDNGKNPRWVPIDQVPKAPVYNILKAKLMVHDILDGKSIRTACKNISIDYDTYCSWRRQFDHFREMIDEARKDRGELYFEKIEEVVGQAREDQDSVALARLKADTYKHLAAVSDPRRFGQKTQIDAKIGVARLSVETGIRRQGDAGYLEKEVFRGIEEGQEKIIVGEKSIPTARVSGPIDGPATEDQKDGMIDASIDGILTKAASGVDTSEA